MCGIVAILNVEPSQELRQKALKMSQKIRHRGPDWSGIYCGGSAILAHERLSIVDPESGGQPLFSPDQKQVLAVNGEIYNHLEIRRRLAGQYEFQTRSDCEVILALYREKGIDFLEDLSGIFAFVLYDEERNEFLIARDPIGVIPLYIGYDSEGTVYVASELKALEGQCERYEPFLPGHYYWSADPGMKRYYRRDWMQFDAVKDNPASVEAIHDALEDAVRRQLMSDVPYGVLLSGGLDSSVVSAIAEKYIELSYITSPDSTTRCPRPSANRTRLLIDENPSASRLRKPVIVGVNSTDDNWSHTMRLISSGMPMLNDLSPASTWNTGTWIFDAATAAANVLFVSPYTITPS